MTGGTCVYECMDGCKKVTEAVVTAGPFTKTHPYGKCRSYEQPKTHWARGKICPMSKTAIIKATLATSKDTKKLNPLKASKRGA